MTLFTYGAILNTLATTPAADAFFPSGYFAKVPAEALGPLAFEGPHRMEHSEFHLFAALCRFRGRAQLVNPSQETLAMMTGMARNNVSRAAHGLQAKGWVRLHHKDGNPHKKIENYELLIPTPGSSPGIAPKPKKVRTKTSEAAPASPVLVEAYASLDSAELGALGDYDCYAVEIDSEPMTDAELDTALAQQALAEAYQSRLQCSHQ